MSTNLASALFEICFWITKTSAQIAFFVFCLRRKRYCELLIYCYISFLCMFQSAIEIPKLNVRPKTAEHLIDCFFYVSILTLDRLSVLGTTIWCRCMFQCSHNHFSLFSFINRRLFYQVLKIKFPLALTYSVHR